MASTNPLVGLVADDLLARVQAQNPTQSIQDELGKRMFDLYFELASPVFDTEALLKDLTPERAKLYRQQASKLRALLNICDLGPERRLLGRQDFEMEVLGGASKREIQEFQLDEAKALLDFSKKFPQDLRRRVGVRLPPDWSVPEAANSVVREFKRIQSEWELLASPENRGKYELLERITAHRMGAYTSGDREGKETWVAAEGFSVLPETHTIFAKRSRVVAIKSVDGSVSAIAQLSVLEYGAVQPRSPHHTTPVTIGLPVKRTIKPKEKPHPDIVVLDSFYARPGLGAATLAYLLDRIYGQARAFEFEKGVYPRWILLDALRGITLKRDHVVSSAVLQEASKVLEDAAQQLGVTKPKDWQPSETINEYSRQVLHDFYRRAGFEVVSVKTADGQPVSKYVDSMVRHYNASNVPVTLDESTLFMTLDLSRK